MGGDKGERDLLFNINNRFPEEPRWGEGRLEGLNSEPCPTVAISVGGFELTIKELIIPTNWDKIKQAEGKLS